MIFGALRQSELGLTKRSPIGKLPHFRWKRRCTWRTPARESVDETSSRAVVGPPMG